MFSENPVELKSLCHQHCHGEIQNVAVAVSWHMCGLRSCKVVILTYQSLHSSHHSRVLFSVWFSLFHSHC